MPTRGGTSRTNTRRPQVPSPATPAKGSSPITPPGGSPPARPGRPVPAGTSRVPLLPPRPPVLPARPQYFTPDRPVPGGGPAGVPSTPVSPAFNRQGAPVVPAPPVPGAGMRGGMAPQVQAAGQAAGGNWLEGLQRFITQAAGRFGEAAGGPGQQQQAVNAAAAPIVNAVTAPARASLGIHGEILNNIKNSVVSLPEK